MSTFVRHSQKVMASPTAVDQPPSTTMTSLPPPQPERQSGCLAVPAALPPLEPNRHGLANLGNTCYLNSALQLLRHARPFTDYLATTAWERHRHPERKAAQLTEETAGLMRALMAPGNSLVIPTSFARAFVTFAREFNDSIHFGAQADAAEAIQILLDGLHMQLSREVRMDITGRATSPEQAQLVRSLESWATFFRKEYSPLVDAFYGQTQTTMRCQACGATSTRYEPWGVYKAPIPGAETAGAPAPTLQSCLRASLAEETIEDYACDSCKSRVKLTMTHAISRFPAHMILSLKRFTNNGSKVRARIPYDENKVDLSEFRAWTSLQSVDQTRYRVIATIEHLGSSRGGHYCMRAREHDGWYLYDDGRVVRYGNGAAGPDTYVLLLERS
jgi:ubiquitin carboxyl-terminal hydrolase 8